MASTRRFWMLWIAFVALFAARAEGYAQLYRGSCGTQPTTSQRRHGAPQPDSSITISAASPAGTPITHLCPGQTYTLTADFGGSTRSALLTVSQGSLEEANEGCSTAYATSGPSRVSSLGLSWVLPCAVTGTATVKVTAGVAETGALQSASTSFSIASSSACSACSDTSTDTSTGTSTGTGNTGASDNSTVTGVSSGSTSTASGNSTPTGNTTSTCAASRLGYNCSIVVDDSVTIHYSYGGDAPSNLCTQAATAATSVTGTMLHYALESALAGYASVGFTAQSGKMVPGDAVIGWVDSSTGSAKVDQYSMSSYDPSGISSTTGWATGPGVLRAAVTSGQAARTVICFSRPVSVATASGRRLQSSVQPTLNPAAVDLIWAAHTSTSLQETHLKQGSLTLNMISGQASKITGAGGSGIAQIVHAVFMLLAFCILMPATGLMARHKWWFADPKTGRISSKWLEYHQLFNQIAVASCVIGFLIAIGLWHDKFLNGDAIHHLYNPHTGIGVAVTVLAVLQLGYSMFPRPGLGSVKRSWWNGLHMILGWSILLLGVIDCILGAVLMEALQHMKLVAWLVPIVAPVALMFIAGFALEYRRRKLLLNGQYDPNRSVVTYGDAGVTSTTGLFEHTGGEVKASSSGGSTIEISAVSARVTVIQGGASLKESGRQSPALGQYTWADVARHASVQSCWIVVNGQVYDVTRYINDHPGGRGIIVSSSGCDVTEDFMAIHSNKAKALLQSFYIGEIVRSQIPSAFPLLVEPRVSRAASPHSTSRAGSPRSRVSRPGAVSPVIMPSPAALDPKAWIACTLFDLQPAGRNCYHMRFALPNKQQQLGLPVGQHLQLAAVIGGQRVIRSYTPISNGATAGYFDLLIKVYKAGEHPQYPEGGKMTQYLAGLVSGNTIEVRGPTGHVVYQGFGTFSINRNPRTVRCVNLIAGGTGITPCWQIIHAITSIPTDNTKVYLLYANECEEDILLRDKLDNLAATRRNFTVHYTLSRPPASRWIYSRGRINREMLQKYLAPASTDVLNACCGPEGMIQQACLPNLLALGFNKEQIVVF